MKGRISLKEFIHGVKQELLDASDNATGPAAFEMTEIELEAEFVLEATAKAEGSFAFFVKVEGGASTSQSHKVTVKMRPLKPPSAVGFGSADASTTSWSAEASAINSFGQPVFVDGSGPVPMQGFPYVQHEPTILLQGSVVGTSEGTPPRGSGSGDA
jgi:hypothetical protein